MNIISKIIEKLPVKISILNFLIITCLTLLTFWWTFTIFHKEFDLKIVVIVIVIRNLVSIILFKDYSLRWSKITQKTFLLKSIVNIVAFFIYLPIFYTKVFIYFLASELFLYLFSINFLMYFYFYIKNYNQIKKTKSVVIYGAGKAGLQIDDELENSQYCIKYFIDDKKNLNNRSINGIKIISKEKFKKTFNGKKYDLLIVAIPNASKDRVEEIVKELSDYFLDIKVLPSLKNILQNQSFTKQLKDVSVEELLSRKPKDLDKSAIEKFIKDKIILITGAGGSIGSEIAVQCFKYGAKELVLLDHSEYNLYSIGQKLEGKNIHNILQSVVNREKLRRTFKKYKPQIVIHAAAYKHVPLCEENVEEAIENNIIGSKNVIDLSVENGVDKLVLISTDKAVRPTNVMGTTKRVCELYAQNIDANDTTIVVVRFGNVLGSSGSVIPKFREQIKNGGPVTVTHPDITRYFMLIPEACQLVLQAASFGEGRELFILDMGKPIKIVDLAKRMIELSGKDVKIKFTGLRAGEKLYEELLIGEVDAKTKYDSIMVAKLTNYDINLLQRQIGELLTNDDKIKKLKEIVPEFKRKS